MIKLELQDNNYDRRLLRHGPDTPPGVFRRFFIRAYHGLRRAGLPRLAPMESFKSRYYAIDQTARPDTLVQIQCIVRKESWRTKRALVEK